MSSSSGGDSHALGSTVEKRKRDHIMRLKGELALRCSLELAPSRKLVEDMTTEEREAQMKRASTAMDAIIDKIRIARSEYGRAEEVFATNTPNVGVQSFMCPRCGNNNTRFVWIDNRTGDTVCQGKEGKADCGEVLQDHQMDRGAAKREFEGDTFKNHHGPPSDRLMPDSFNMRTNLVAISRPGVPLGDAPSIAKRLAAIAHTAEMDSSNFGHFGKANTRAGYKNEHKIKASELMNNFACKYNIHDKVVEKAREEFSKYREVRERVEKFESTVASCIILCYEDLAPQLGDIKHYDSVRSHVNLGGVEVTKKFLEDNEAHKRAQEDSMASNDVAIKCVATKKVGEWDYSDLNTWIEGVLGTDIVKGKEKVAAVKELVDTVRNDTKHVVKLDPGADPGDFKATVKEGFNRFDILPTAKYEQSAETAGMRLIKINRFGEINVAKEVRDAVNSALQRRLKYQRKAAVREKDLDFEVKRIIQARGTNIEQKADILYKDAKKNNTIVKQKGSVTSYSDTSSAPEQETEAGDSEEWMQELGLPFVMDAPPSKKARTGD